MDFWLESAKPFNQICVDINAQQANPSAGMCNSLDNAVNNQDFCLDATQFADPENAASALDGGNGSIRGAGCKHDGGPLWVSIPLLDDPVVANNAGE